MTMIIIIVITIVCEPMFSQINLPTNCASTFQ